MEMYRAYLDKSMVAALPVDEDIPVCESLPKPGTLLKYVAYKFHIFRFLVLTMTSTMLVTALGMNSGKRISYDTSQSYELLCRHRFSFITSLS